MLNYSLLRLVCIFIKNFGWKKSLRFSTSHSPTFTKINFPLSAFATFFKNSTNSGNFSFGKTILFKMSLRKKTNSVGDFSVMDISKLPKRDFILRGVGLVSDLKPAGSWKVTESCSVNPFSSACTSKRRVESADGTFARLHDICLFNHKS